MKKELKKKAISPVIATTLLIAIVVIIALIVFLWFRNVVGDYGEKFGKNIELACEDVMLGASYSGGMLFVTNDGIVPVFKLNLKISSGGSYETLELGAENSWPEEGLKQGGVYAGTVAEVEAPNVNEVILTPVLIGISDKGNRKTYVCGEQYGYQIIG